MDSTIYVLNPQKDYSSFINIAILWSNQKRKSVCSILTAGIIIWHMLAYLIRHGVKLIT